MKFTLGWLKEHLDTAAALDEIVATLTRVGLEVEGVADPAAALAGFTVARVLTAERHPQADKLQVLTVDTGDGTSLQVVCGAPNARAGLVGVLGRPGAVVPANGMELKVSAIRGVESNGMMCSTRELQLGEEHDGIVELPDDAPVGTAFAAYAGLADPVIDVSITPNRPDCMGVRGIARDLAAAGLGTLRPLQVPGPAGLGADPNNSVRAEPVEALSFSAADEKGSPLRLAGKAGRSGQASTSSGRTVREISSEGEAPHVILDDPEGCPAYYAQCVRGARNGPAPDWLANRLRAIGQRPISALVDITNYVMIDLGRPLHVFDMATLDGPQHVRRARAGETFAALNGKSYALDETMTVIADSKSAHDLGGIMGGEHSGCSDTTTDALIECAYFDPDHIARTGQKLQLTSDARSRFERGVDPAFLDDGLAIATALVLELCGGTPSPVTRAGTPPAEMPTFRYDPSLTETLGGLEVPPYRQAEILKSLGFKAVDPGTIYLNLDAGPWDVTPPTWRPDIDGSADLVEEVIRIEGIDNVPSTPLPRPAGVARPTATPAQKLERRLRRAAATRGLDEAVTWSFVSQAEADAVGGGAWTLANPISEELKVMRPSLLPGLVAAAERNLRRGAGTVRLFELGRRYLAKDGQPDERPTLALVLAGDRRPRGWREGKAAPFDAYDAKAEALALLAAAGAPVDNLQVMQPEGDAWHPGRAGTLRLGPKTVLAAFGMLHPRLARAFDLPGDAAAVELYLDALPAKRGSGFARAAFTPPALQPVRRDFAFAVPADLTADALARAVKGTDKTAIVAARVFDVFERDGEKSMAVETILQPGDKAFVEADLKAIADKVVAAAARLGATLRG